ncbi:hypothetical protein RB653_003453 [Dictyostelium firmibasis]|uniref:Uncharacterized protein n=1 Tax=Dictyostelium firmibasis TaxID=79012 RepID=A0AAN7U4N3_9MYCE
MLTFKILLILLTFSFIFAFSNGNYSINVLNQAPGSKCENGTLAELNTCNKDCLTSFLIIESNNKRSLIFTTFNNYQCTGDFITQITFDCNQTPQNISQTKYLVSCDSLPKSTVSSHSLETPHQNNSTKSTSVFNSTKPATHSTKSNITTPPKENPTHSSSSLVTISLTSSLLLALTSLFILYGL